MAKKNTEDTPVVPVAAPSVADPGVVVRDSGITINDNILQPRVLPLIVTLPADASKAQIKRAKILNAYAYSNPKGWALKKDRLIKELEDLKTAPDPVEDPNAPKLSVGTPMPTVLPE